MTRHTLLALAMVFVLGVSGAIPGVTSASRDDAPTLTRTVANPAMTSVTLVYT